MAGDSYRAELVEKLQLTEASISRIVAELKAEQVIHEYTPRASTQPGRPTQVVALNRSVHVLGLELSNGRVAAGIGTLGGEIQQVHRAPLPAQADTATVERITDEVLGRVMDWARAERIELQQVAVALPGFGALGVMNAILPIDAQRLRALVARRVGSVPIAITNSVQARAALHGFGIRPGTAPAEHLFVFVGHGVGATRIGKPELGAEHRPMEIGHVVMDPDGPTCRCGHRGCLEAYAALPAVAQVLGVPETDLLSDSAPDTPLAVKGKARERVASMLRRLGLAIGNAINIDPADRVVIAGWPARMPADLRDVVLEGLDMSVLGGVAAASIGVTFISPTIGDDPLPALCYGAYAYAWRGATVA